MAGDVSKKLLVPLPSPIFVVACIATGAVIYAVVYLALGGREIFGLLRRAPNELRA